MLRLAGVSCKRAGRDHPIASARPIRIFCTSLVPS
jgi:hypothetical protein